MSRPTSQDLELGQDFRREFDGGKINASVALWHFCGPEPCHNILLVFHINVDVDFEAGRTLPVAELVGFGYCRMMIEYTYAMRSMRVICSNEHEVLQACRLPCDSLTVAIPKATRLWTDGFLNDCNKRWH